MEDAEAAMGALEDELADPGGVGEQVRVGEVRARNTAARRAVEVAYARPETLID